MNIYVPTNTDEMAAASIHVGRITRVQAPLPAAPDGVINLNLLNFFPTNVHDGIPLYELVPYCLRDSEGHIHENIWQFSKVYPAVAAQHEIKAGKVIWSHPAEVHVKDGAITDAYLKWRQKGYDNPYAVRYPNGFHGRNKCIGALWFDGEWKILDYVTARKKIYCPTYVALARLTPAYQKLKAMVDAGHSLQICEMDVRPGVVTEEVLRHELNNTVKPFGHGYVLAAMLLGCEHIFEE